MNLFRYNTEYLEPQAVLLGFFDCLHLGHYHIIENAKHYAEANKCQTTIMTFMCHTPISEKEGLPVFSLEGRIMKAKKIGIDNVLYIDFNEKFKEQTPREFLDSLLVNLNVKAFFCGYDYKFGKDASGDIGTLKEYCKEKNIDLHILNKFVYKGFRVSSTLIKEYLQHGEIDKANEFLGLPYFTVGKVEKGRSVGRTMGFPTINLPIDENLLQIKDGVYQAYLYIDGIKYNALANYGACPTFNISDRHIEVYVEKFNREIYDEKVVVYFTKYLRKIERFTSIDKLKQQITFDLESIRD